MHLLVIGAGGQLGRNVVRAASERNHEIIGTYHTTDPKFDCPLTKLDVTDNDAIERVFDESQPEAVINCAAATDVDACESHPQHAGSVNADAAGQLAQLAHEHAAAFVHPSTDYVFDGEAEIKYSEDAETNPLQVYGKTKLEGEKRVRSKHPGALVARLSFVYGREYPSGEICGFPAWVRDTVRDGETVPLFTDQFVTPTRAGQAAATFLDLLERGASGTYHVAARSCVSPYEFGIKLLDALDLPRRVEKGSMTDMNRPAVRPRHSCLDVSQLESTLRREQPAIEEDIEALVTGV